VNYGPRPQLRIDKWLAAFTLISVKYWYIGLQVLALSPWTMIMSSE